MREILADQIEHAQMSKIDANHIVSNEEVTALVIEDYGTTGLTGAIDDEDEDNFDMFWREHGTTNKPEDDLGSHGLGKIVFAGASRIRVFFGATVRSIDSDTTHLMGHTVLDVRRTTENGKKIAYQPHAFYADMENEGDIYDEIPVPIRDQSAVDKFKEYFKLKRNEPGLSVVIPYPLKTITTEEIIKFVIENYFYAVMAGRLKVIVDNVDINKDNFREIVSKFTKKEDLHDINLRYDFVGEVISIKKSEPERILTLKPNWSSDGKLTKDDFTQEDLDRAIEAFKDNEIIAVRLPMKIEYKKGRPKDTSFDVFIKQHDDLKRGKDMYIRKILSISQEENFGVRRALGMMIASDPVMYAFLTASEDESHVTFQRRCKKLSDKYKKTTTNINLVKNALRELYDVLSEVSIDLNLDSLSEFFGMPGSKGRRVIKSTPWPIKVPNRKKLDQFYIKDTSDGFIVTSVSNEAIEKAVLNDEIKIAATEHAIASLEVPPRNPSQEEKEIYSNEVKNIIRNYQPDDDINADAKNTADDLIRRRFPQTLELEMAYHRTKGNPFKKYSNLDFALQEEDGVNVSINDEGSGEIKSQDGNKLTIEVKKSPFKVSLSGFDKNRDLRVRVKS